METSRYVWTSAALLLLTLGARTAMADQGYAYALITDGTAATVSAAFSLNPGGGAITATRTGTGAYTVVFPNSGIGNGWAVLATAYGANANYCNILAWGSGDVGLQCYNSCGVAANSPFTLLAISNNNDKNIAFAWANADTTASYAPDGSNAYNPSGAINIYRDSQGAYEVLFNGLSGDGPSVQMISAVGSTASCQSYGTQATARGSRSWDRARRGRASLEAWSFRVCLQTRAAAAGRRRSLLSAGKEAIR